jgi:hypothetical protein
LFLRDKISTAFVAGNALNDYVEVQLAELDGVTVARVRVTPRRNLCYLKDKDGRAQVYRRQGNRSVKAEIWELEEIVRTRDSLSR